MKKRSLRAALFVWGVSSPRSGYRAASPGRVQTDRFHEQMIGDGRLQAPLQARSQRGQTSPELIAVVYRALVAVNPVYGLAFAGKLT